MEGESKTRVVFCELVRAEAKEAHKLRRPQDRRGGGKNRSTQGRRCGSREKEKPWAEREPVTLAGESDDGRERGERQNPCWLITS